MFIYYFLSLIFFINNLSSSICQNQNGQGIEINKKSNTSQNIADNNQKQQNELESISKNFLNPYAFYRIDSLYNGYIITLNQHVKLKLSTKGDIQNFIFTEFENSYSIESRFGKKIGVNDNNKVIAYDKNEGIKDKMLWYIKLDNSNKNRNETQIILQNKFNLKYLEINVINETYSTLICNSSNYRSIEYYKAVFTLTKIFELGYTKQEHMNFIENEPIDIVIKYIDLSDKELNREGIKQVKKDEDNQELKYSVRSIIQYAPWVRKIFIIMPNKKVRYFKPYDEIKDKFVYIKDKDLIGFDSANSAVFQFNLFRLKSFGLSDNFIYMDDDYFFGKELKKSDFFYYDEEIKKVLPFVCAHDFKEMDYNETISLYNKLFDSKKMLDPHKFWGWKLSILASEKLLLENFNIKPMITSFFTHVAVPLNIHDIEECYDLILRRYKYIEETLYSLERHILILQSEHLFVLYALNIKQRKVHSISYNFIPLESLRLEYLYAPLYVINTNGDSINTDKDFKNMKDILEKRYPERTKYELPFDPPEQIEEIKKEDIKEIKENKENKENENKNKVEIKKDAKIDFNLTKNEFYMDSIFVQKKKELEIKYRNKITEYKKAIWRLFLIFICLVLLVFIIILYSKIKINISFRKYEILETSEETEKTKI